jgi:nucleoside-diphosphate-sugar epimerase
MFNPSPSLCRHFKRSRVLIVGCGDVGLRAAALLLPHVRVMALSSSPERLEVLRQAGIQPLLGNLDDACGLRRLSGLAHRVLHLAPPPRQGLHDPRTQRLLQALSLRTTPKHIVYGSTSGVYGDAQGAWVDETRAVNPQTDRAHRRVHAEALLRQWGGAGRRTTVLRIPGIYAFDREGGDPRERLQQQAPLLRAQDDVYTNHIHADDLARACVLALWRGPTQQAIHVVDDQAVKMGDYFDAVAAHFGLPQRPRLSRQDAEQQLTPMQWSFMNESRRLSNQRMNQRLRLRLRYPTVQTAIKAIKAIKAMGF